MEEISPNTLGVRGMVTCCACLYILLPNIILLVVHQTNRDSRYLSSASNGVIPQQVVSRGDRHDSFGRHSDSILGEIQMYMYGFLDRRASATFGPGSLIGRSWGNPWLPVPSKYSN
ncbi:hypothetical protein M378DRAFT_162835 [Amanita muscaria Koide BX008]|uniref:Uncharacterized protein n=1 Tax=Amanita muscaria (strain Koide BX008) TaxID=946122 RepID=A0A0C2X611_AMAMK|nr:hypothetical protein M378DRAFT_162835 [Amanita muscaria Koide BX008]